MNIMLMRAAAINTGIPSVCIWYPCLFKFAHTNVPEFIHIPKLKLQTSWQYIL